MKALESINGKYVAVASRLNIKVGIKTSETSIDIQQTVILCHILEEPEIVRGLTRPMVTAAEITNPHLRRLSIRTFESYKDTYQAVIDINRFGGGDMVLGQKREIIDFGYRVAKVVDGELIEAINEARV